MESFHPIIGLEVHIELETKSKMFCACSASHFGKKPNTQVCPVCLGLPGALPVPNKKAILWTVLLGMALGCEIPPVSRFDRKNYFYPDLPKGYQISQHEMPLAQNGKWKMENGKWIRIKRVHLEEDTGKLIHEEKTTLIDFNRSGVPLVEIVTEPDISSALEAKQFLEELQRLVRYLGISRAEMEKGEMRCEPTVNLEIKEGGKRFYTPLVEIKNINSFRFVQKAIDFEIRRQFEEFKKNRKEKEAGNKTTRGWNEILGETVLQRLKEEAADYRYFPEPDIPPIKWRKEEIKNLRKMLPELPREKVKRFQKEYNLSEYQAKILTEARELADFYEKAVIAGQKTNVGPGEIANIIINKKIDIRNISPTDLTKILVRKRLKPKITTNKLEQLIKRILKKNQKAVNDYKKGKITALEFLIGQIIRETKGRADPNFCRKFLLENLR